MKFTSCVCLTCNKLVYEIDSASIDIQDKAAEQEHRESGHEVYTFESDYLPNEGDVSNIVAGLKREWNHE